MAHIKNKKVFRTQLIRCESGELESILRLGGSKLPVCRVVPGSRISDKRSKDSFHTVRRVGYLETEFGNMLEVELV